MANISDYLYGYSPSIDYSTVTDSGVTYNRPFSNYLGDALSSIGNTLYDGTSAIGNLFNTQIGSGNNATTVGQLGLGLGLGAWSLLNQNSQWKDQLALAKEQYEFNKGVSQADFINQGTNFLNQSLFQLEGLNAFNSDAGAERASNLTSAVNQLNNAGTKIGVTNAFNDQANSIAKYNTLAG